MSNWTRGNDRQARGLERFAWVVFVLAAVGVGALLGGLIWGVWTWLT